MTIGLLLLGCVACGGTTAASLECEGGAPAIDASADSTREDASAPPDASAPQDAEADAAKPFDGGFDAAYYCGRLDFQQYDPDGGTNFQFVPISFVTCQPVTLFGVGFLCPGLTVTFGSTPATVIGPGAHEGELVVRVPALPSNDQGVVTVSNPFNGAKTTTSVLRPYLVVGCGCGDAGVDGGC